VAASANGSPWSVCTGMRESSTIAFQILGGCGPRLGATSNASRHAWQGGPPDLGSNEVREKSLTGTVCSGVRWRFVPSRGATAVVLSSVNDYATLDMLDRACAEVAPRGPTRTATGRNRLLRVEDDPHGFCRGTSQLPAVGARRARVPPPARYSRDAKPTFLARGNSPRTSPRPTDLVHLEMHEPAHRVSVAADNNDLRYGALTIALYAAIVAMDSYRTSQGVGPRKLHRSRPNPSNIGRWPSCTRWASCNCMTAWVADRRDAVGYSGGRLGKFGRHWQV